MGIFIKRIKDIKGYNHLSASGKARFWCVLPLVYARRSYYVIGWYLFVKRKDIKLLERLKRG